MQNDEDIIALILLVNFSKTQNIYDPVIVLLTCLINCSINTKIDADHAAQKTAIVMIMKADK